jgi:hypothetical protein
VGRKKSCCGKEEINKVKKLGGFCSRAGRTRSEARLAQEISGRRRLLPVLSVC